MNRPLWCVRDVHLILSDFCLMHPSLFIYNFFALILISQIPLFATLLWVFLMIRRNRMCCLQPLFLPFMVLSYWKFSHQPSLIGCWIQAIRFLGIPIILSVPFSVIFVFALTVLFYLGYLIPCGVNYLPVLCFGNEIRFNACHWVCSLSSSANQIRITSLPHILCACSHAAIIFLSFHYCFSGLTFGAIQSVRNK